MGDIILMVYAHDHKHKQFIQFWREFRERHPEAKNTPELARIEFYNLRYDPADKHSVKKELNSFIRNETVFGINRKSKIIKIALKIFNLIFKKKFSTFNKLEEKPFLENPLGGEFCAYPIFEKEDTYEWNKNQ